MRQVGYLQELFRDARSAEHKKRQQTSELLKTYIILCPAEQVSAITRGLHLFISICN